MKIGVVADTHSKELPPKLREELSKVDLILHAGDLCETRDLEVFESIGEIKAVYGNMDSPEVVKQLQRTQVVSCGAFKIGLFHGEGPPDGVLDRVREEFKDKDVQAVVFGHSHQPLNRKIGGVLFFNPGSPNDDIFAPYKSFGILDVSPKGITGKIIKL